MITLVSIREIIENSHTRPEDKRGLMGEGAQNSVNREL